MYRIRVASRHPSHKEILKQGQMPKFPVRVRVRFGSTNKHRKCAIDFNSIEAIERTANKLKMKEIFSVAGVRSPKYLVNRESAYQPIMDGYLGDKIFFKTPFHSRGRGMKIYDDKGVAVSEQKSGYFEESCISKREFRVHVMDGEAFHIDEKRPRDRSMKMSDRPIVKNMSNGFKFRRPIKDFPQEVVTESIKAVECLGLVFGAADVGLNDDGVWIYEVNTAPSLRTKTRKLYQKALVKAIWKRILGEKRFTVWAGGVEVSDTYIDADTAKEVVDSYIEQGYDDAVIQDIVEEKSREYNEWLDAQPLTPSTDELKNEEDDN